MIGGNISSSHLFNMDANVSSSLMRVKKKNGDLCKNHGAPLMEQQMLSSSYFCIIYPFWEC